eukprot:CAMPEP_0175625324 /NCGR_PEP_ID=MMETSP0096-20121207/70408_1 /TAXON_ID=311494 /ORGANISM="Alexandrium monilatum, Strain CCMP3105" /LENGTH=58 /DNA_ID=CAMNT_0016930653 /DNA_START=303 /DNA_END=476 /DNA_ORIENTATION=-
MQPKVPKGLPRVDHARITAPTARHAAISAQSPAASRSAPRVLEPAQANAQANAHGAPQ